MAKDTSIEWSDSTLNLQVGCDGCELWAGKVKWCYAGVLVGRYGKTKATADAPSEQRKGWPKSFDKPEIYPYRMDEALAWSDMTGEGRPEKEWLSNLPRMIFLDDMGDTFTESLPEDWLKPFLPIMAGSPHIYLCLTKRGERMRDFSRRVGGLPPNVWPGVSVTSNRSAERRLKALSEVEGGGPKFVSFEPALEQINWPECIRDVRWLITGGMSGRNRATNLAWIRDAYDHFPVTTCLFTKQIGDIVHEDYYMDDENRRGWLLDNRHRLLVASGRGGYYEHDPRVDGQPPPGTLIEWYPGEKGGIVAQWPDDLKKRTVPGGGRR